MDGFSISALIISIVVAFISVFSLIFCITKTSEPGPRGPRGFVGKPGPTGPTGPTGPSSSSTGQTGQTGEIDVSSYTFDNPYILENFTNKYIKLLGSEQNYILMNKEPKNAEDSKFYVDTNSIQGEYINLRSDYYYLNGSHENVKLIKGHLYTFITLGDEKNMLITYSPIYKRSEVDQMHKSYKNQQNVVF